MRKAYYAALLAMGLPMAAMAQSAIDAQQISQGDFKGTARFMSMGGAFTALGGDLSTLGQNPAGIGVYRSNEVGVTLDINFQNTKTEPHTLGFANTNSQTKTYCNNFGYVGSTRLDGVLQTLNWGVSYGRATSFDRVYNGYVPRTQTSLSNYIAAFSAGTPGYEMEFNDAANYNPYFNSSADWLSILAYSSYMINPVSNDTYQGLYQNGTSGDMLYRVRETGYVDEYNMSVGGNVENLVYWGIGVGITDLHYTRTMYYSESMADAAVYSPDEGAITTGSAGFDLNTRKYINGTGWNLKAGVIIKPINEFRIGLAVHTPTWYHLEQGYDGTTNFAYTPTVGQFIDNTTEGNDYTEDAFFRWHYKAPWKLMAGMAGVIGGRAIISVDYQYDGYGSQSIKTPTAYYDGYEDGFENNDVLNADIKNYFKASNTVRLGLEYRVTPQFSVRAGYNYTTTNVKSEAENGSIEVFSSGTDASYTFNKNRQNISFGLGYRYGSWYIDAAYVYSKREGTFHAYTDFDGFRAPTNKVTDNNSSLVISTGFKF